MLGTKTKVEFGSLSLSQTEFSELKIFTRAGIPTMERSGQLDLLEDISKLKPKTGFNKVKEVYREVISSIKKKKFN